MAKATITLSNGTVVTVEGTPDEVRALLEHYGSAGAPKPHSRPASTAKQGTRKRRGTALPPRSSASQASGLDLAAIVNLVKNCDEAEFIEATILDRASQVNRTLLPLYIVHKYLDDSSTLSSGDVSRVTRDLGVPVSQPNASRTLSTTASKYVMGDGVRKKGSTVRYRLSRRGLQYMQAVIGGSSGGE
jgi:hypothetical protein